jgi:hypothetical protein
MTFPLNLPVQHMLDDCENILIAGAGGGFDVFVGLPLYFHLLDQGKSVHLANYSFMDLGIAKLISRCEALIPDLLIATYGDLKRPTPYYPEGYLAQGFQELEGEVVPVWMIEKTGVPRVRQAYEKLVEHLSIDAIILVDGGIDSLMRGNEEGAGTFLEDTVSVTAVADLDNVPIKILGAVGMGTEIEEIISHHAFLENTAALAKVDGFYGTCALLPQMESFQRYEKLARYVFESEGHEASRIQTRLIPAVWGMFGDFNWYNHPRQPEVFLSPLTSLYWFYDVEKVNSHSLIADLIRDSETFQHAVVAFQRYVYTQGSKGNAGVRRRERLPLT